MALVLRLAPPRGPRACPWRSIGFIDVLPADRRDQSNLLDDLVRYEACIHRVITRGYPPLELRQSRVCP
jgi:hypothetical protein